MSGVPAGMMVTMMRASRAGRLAVDALVCLIPALATAAGSTATVAAWLPRYAIVPLAIAQGVVLLGRRRAPMTVLALTTIVGVFMTVAGYPGGSASFGAWCAAYAVAVYRPGGEGAELAETLRGAAAVLAAAVAFGLATLAPDARNQAGAWGQLYVGALTVASWILGYAIHIRRAYITELKDRAARLEAEEGERAARAVVDERLRIARELHDVIGHSISLITIQSEAAARSVRTNPDAVPGFLATISDVSRQALAELRNVLAVLRPDTEAEMSPQPGLEQLGELVARLNAGGLRTRLDAEPMDLPAGVGLTVYRIVQESLTNVVKHAGAGARAGVTVDRCGGLVRVSVHDDGAGPSGPVSSAAHGIVGMRERAAVYGGTLRTGARPGGGFQVEALIPVPEEAR
jgi:signal transduction histidine kinase